METRLSREAEQHYGQSALLENLRRCVHCGFCNATCPTYQLWGDELDGPRGRLYQIKAAMEGAPAGGVLVEHLDRCLTCRACETTCPSGVEYSAVLEIGREFIERQRLRPWWQRVTRQVLAWGLNQRLGLQLLVTIGRTLRIFQQYPSQVSPVTKDHLLAKGAIPSPPAPPVNAAQGQTVIFLNACVQNILERGIDDAAKRVVEWMGASVLLQPQSGCCGALALHLSQYETAKSQARINIDVWESYLSNPHCHIVISASGCALQVKEYPQLLKDDPRYAERAKAVAARVLDLSEWVARHWPAALHFSAHERVAVQSPCSLQHGQKLSGELELFLQKIGLVLVPVADGHLCCGSAGSYSLLNPTTSTSLRARKLSGLTAQNPDVILTANIGCYQHLKPHSPTPLWHWIQWVDAKIQGII